MDSRGEGSQGRLPKAKKEDRTKNKQTTNQENSNKARREKYNSVDSYRDTVKCRSRKYYRNNNPKVDTKLIKSKGAPLQQPIYVQVYKPNDIGVLMDIEGHTIPSVGLALGKSKLTIKRWIEMGVIPKPIYRGTLRDYWYYTKDEIIALAREVYNHELGYDYLGVGNTNTINSIHQSIEHCRKELGEHNDN